MGYPTNPPPYPVLDREPSVAKTIAAFRRSDWTTIAAAVGASAPFGYVVGRPILMVPSMWCATGFGAFGGLCIGLQSSFGRLTGYLPNDVEVASAAAGAAPATDLTS
jgi:NADH-ubiquinone oxidoreductase complex I, 21 kDa subunit